MLTDVLGQVLMNLQMAPWWVWAGMGMGVGMMATAELWGDAIEAWCVRHRVQRLVSRLMWLPLMVLMLVMLLAGCAGSRFATQMDAEVGRMTALEAIETFGAPTYAQEINGQIIMAWERRSYSSSSYQPVVAAPPVGGGFWGGAMRGLQSVGPFTTTIEERETLTLLFDADGRLQSWQLITR
jgi:hypothetical protein